MDGVRSRWAKPLAALGAMLGWTGLVLQLYLSIGLSITRNSGVLPGLIAYFSFFTILTNILVALALTVATTQRSSGSSRFLSQPTIQTGIAASIALVGIAYTLLLQHLWDPKGLQLVADLLLHYAMPALFLLYWWIAVPKRDLRWGNIWQWALYPIAYFIFAMIRGATSGAYPYPFIDPTELGYLRVVGNAAGILLGFAVVASLLVAVGRLEVTTQRS